MATTEIDDAQADRLAAELGQVVTTIAAVPDCMTPHTWGASVGLQCPGGPFKRSRLTDYLGQIIADAVFIGGQRIIVNVAPRRGKSEIVSFASPTWFLEHFPQQRAILATHTAALSLDFGRRIRNEFQRNERLTTRLQDDAQAANQWNTEQGGGLKTVGVGSAVLGFGGKLVIVDDAHAGWIEAQSPTDRRGVADWFDGTLMTRLEPGASVIVVGQRLHRDDLSGHLIRNSKDRWRVIRLPAIAQAGDPMGRRIGDPISPERFSVDEERHTQAVTPRVMYAAMYDQNPDESKEGRTYSGYSAENVDAAASQLARAIPVFVTFDFNVNPGMHALIGQNDPRADLIKFRHEIFGERMKTPECARAAARRLRADGGGTCPYPRVVIHGDRSGKTENTQTVNTDYALIAQAFAAEGITQVEFRVPAANPPIKARVASVNEALCDSSGARHVKLHPDCRRLINDFENVEDDVKTGLPDKSNSEMTHASDAGGYAIHMIRPVVQPAMTGGRMFSGGRR